MACWPVAPALLFAEVKKGDAYLFWPLRRVQWWGSLAEQPLPATSPGENGIMFGFEGSYLNEIRVFLHPNWFQYHLVRSGNPKKINSGEKKGKFRGMVDDVR